jgi:hypothetical protein
MGTNTITTLTNTTCTRASDSLILDILYSEFGNELVSQALKYKDYYKTFKMNNANLVSDSFDTLSYKWQMGKSKEYLESLEVDLQYCLICHLAGNYINDKTRLDCVLNDF